jgi:antitoxin (DNA-binding transcriptional repressor) of toxin-antitoxin stability system
MTTYSVADAKAGLPQLIDRALEGEEVIITRHGRPVVEIRATRTPQVHAGHATYEWLRARRVARKGVGLTSVELLNQLYEEP